MEQSAGIWIFLSTALLFSILGIYYARKSSKSVEQYITSRNSLSAFMGTSTIFATGMGAWILFSPAESAIIAGIFALLMYAVASALSMWIFLIVGPRIRKIMPKGHTLTEFVLHRYGKYFYYLVLSATVIYMFLALCAELTGIALAAKMVFGMPLYFSAFIVAAGTAAYVYLGGFRTSVFTDFVQAIFIIPLLIMVFVGSFYIMGSSVFSKAQLISPEAFKITNTGIEYGLALLIAIIGAELFNQSWWQRVYSAKNRQAMSMSFLFSGVLVIPAILLAGLFGFFALASNNASSPSVAFFGFIATMPNILIILAMMLAIALIMSTIDTLLNGIVSIFTVDFARINPKTGNPKLLKFAQATTLALSIIAVFIASMGYSVLYLFLLADLICVALVFPVFYGMFSGKASPGFALASGMLGLICGLILFPNPSFTRGSLLWSFVAALVVPAIMMLISRNDRFDFRILRKVKEFD
jgi:Na+/proline symporter